MLNPIATHSHFHETPTGFDAAVMRQHVTVLVAIAVGIHLPLPGAEVDNAALQSFFYENAGQYKSVMFEINEVVPFEVDRAQQLAAKIYQRRFDLAYRPTPLNVLSPENPFSEIFIQMVPEFDKLHIMPQKIALTVQLFESQFGKEAA